MHELLLHSSPSSKSSSRTEIRPRENLQGGEVGHAVVAGEMEEVAEFCLYFLHLRNQLF